MIVDTEAKRKLREMNATDLLDAFERLDEQTTGRHASCRKPKKISDETGVVTFCWTSLSVWLSGRLSHVFSRRAPA